MPFEKQTAADKFAYWGGKGEHLSRIANTPAMHHEAARSYFKAYEAAKLMKAPIAKKWAREYLAKAQAHQEKAHPDGGPRHDSPIGVRGQERPRGAVQIGPHGGRFVVSKTGQKSYVNGRR